MTTFSLDQVARNVADQLEGFTTEPVLNADSQPISRRMILRRASDGAELHFREDCRNSDRINVSGEYPDYLGSYPTRYEISVSKRRNPAAVARDIERRLLPKCLPELERTRQVIARLRGCRAAAERRGRRAAHDPRHFPRGRLPAPGPRALIRGSVDERPISGLPQRQPGLGPAVQRSRRPRQRDRPARRFHRKERD